MTILKIESGNFATSLTTATLSQNRTITLPNASGELTLRSQLATVATTGSYNDLSNKPSFPATPKAYVTQTWRNGASWYRRWSDGFIEQGGLHSSSVVNNNITVSLNIPFTSTQYTLTFGVQRKDMWINGWGFGWKYRTTSSFIFYVDTIGNSDALIGIGWYACGY